MKTYRFIILSTLASLAIAALAYSWAAGMTNSLYAYRSPLHDNPPVPGEPLGRPLTHRVVLILIDALRDDTSRKIEVMPFLNGLRQQGAWATVHSRTPSYSDPGYSVLMTGAWPDLSDGPAMNLPYEDTPTWTQDNLFSAAQRAGLKTAVAGYYWFEKLIPQRAVDASFYTHGDDKAADREVVDAALPWMKSGEYNFILIHIDQVDYAGHHEGGPRDARWGAAASRADDLVREIAASLDLSRDTVLVVSDHGQIDRGGHGGQEQINLLEPFVLVGAGVRTGQYPDIQQVDVAPTVAALLGLNIPAANQGRVLSEMLNLTAEQTYAIQAALSTQQGVLAKAYSAATGKPLKFEPGEYSVLSTQRAIEDAKNSRLNAERLPRFILAAIVALIPAVILVWKRSKMVAWLAASSALYLVLFNIRYAILDGRTYSLSSIASAEDIVTFTAVTATLSLLISWWILNYALRLYKQEPRQAAQTVLAFVLVTLYLLSLPILYSFAMNGALVTWALPDMASMFLGFLSTLQSLIVAVVGLLLSGGTALISRFVTKRGV